MATSATCSTAAVGRPGGTPCPERLNGTGKRTNAWVAFMLVSAFVTTAHADETDLKALTDESERVAYARIELVESFWGTVNGQQGIFTRVRARVMETWKGPSEDELEIYLVGGVVGDRAVMASHQPSFKRGEEVVLFAFRGGDVLFPTGEAGKWIVRRKPGAPPTVVSQVGGWSGSGIRASEMTLAELRDRVGQLVATP